MREAIFYKKGKSLYFFDSKNTAGWIPCPNVSTDRKLIKKSGISQTLTFLK
jgi:hypothetical protein